MRRGSYRGPLVLEDQLACSSELNEGFSGSDFTVVSDYNTS